MRLWQAAGALASLVLTISASSSPGLLTSIPAGEDLIDACEVEATSRCRAGQRLFQLHFGERVASNNAKLSPGALAERDDARTTHEVATRQHRQPIADQAKVKKLRRQEADEKAASLEATAHGPPLVRALALVCMALCVTMFVVVLHYDSKYHRKLSRSAASFAKCCSSHSLRCDSADDVVGACPNLPELKDLMQLAKIGGIVPLIENSAKVHRGRAALIDNADGSVTTYEDLIATVRALSQQLRNAGVDDGDIIALLFKPSKMLIVAALAVMDAGAIWLPLDADSPTARLRQLLELAGARLGLGFKPWDGIVDPPICSLGPDCLLNCGPDLTLSALPAMANCPAGSAAVFFTSGSTGTPKGVIYGRETILHGVVSMSWLCSMNSKSVSLLKTPPYWAVIEYEMFPALVTGGTVVCDSHCQTDSSRLSRILMDRRITVLMTSDQVLRLLIQGAWKGNNQDLLPSIPKSLAHVVNVGGPLSLETCADVSALMPHVLVHNIYGCTESACTQWTYMPGIPSGTIKRAPAGRPQPGSEVYIVDGNLRPVPQGEEGEICFGGAYLSYGYLGDHKLTEARFVQAPRRRERMYRTGDVGRWIADPASTDELVLEVIGRVDRQLNLRGVRVAPEEIEAVLLQAPGAQEAAVVAASNSIVAYVQGKNASLSGAARELCSQKLASSMRPVLIRQVASLPLLRNGKVDLAALARRAADDLKQDMVEAVDSLGMMQRVTKDQVTEFHTLAAARGLATAANLLWHWYWVFPVGEAGPRWQGPSQQDLDKSIPSTWLQILLSGFLGYEWTTQVFIMASAYTERKTAEQGRTMYPRQELFTILLYLALWWPVANLFSAVQSGLGNTYIKCSLEAFLSFRWYLAVYLLCRLLHRYVLVPLEESFASVPEITAHVGRAFFAGSWWLLQLAYGGGNFNLCPGLDPNGYAFKVAEFVWPLTLKPTATQTYCSAFFHPWLFSSLALYVSAWFYGPSLVAWVKETSWLRRLGPLPMPWTASFFALVLLLGHPPVRDYLDTFQDIFYWISCFYSVLLFMALAQWSDGPWLRRTGLAWSGHASLGTYCFHMYFLCNQYCADPAGPDRPLVVCDRGMLFFSYKNERIIPSPVEMMQMLVPYGGLVQLLVLLAYFFGFTLFVGMPLQFACLKIYSWIEQSILQIVDVWKGSNKSFQPVRL
mmetsp:Transcript_68078/g.121258  ORF Transcript_68078/g.121258 Transcript_68078/m.121258 type:complete len:1175 (+) Transcript_68078:119-3643(+)